MSQPIAYFITFSTYGTWLHGNEKGSIDNRQNRYNSPMVPASAALETSEKNALKNQPIILTPEHRKLIILSVQNVCKYRNWSLHAIHVRSNHVHIVVSGDVTPEQILKDFKRYATRILRENHPDQFKNIKVWTRHGSTKYIWDQKSLVSTIDYVINEQGNPMQWWCRYDIHNAKNI